MSDIHHRSYRNVYSAYAYSRVELLSCAELQTALISIAATAQPIELNSSLSQSGRLKL
jgi:hypothetical protein